MPFSLPGMTAEGPEPPGASVETSAPEDPADYVAEGMGHLDQAIAAFSRGCESGDADIVPLAIELLARTLPLRGRDADAALVWQRGLEDPDPVVSTAVRTRLRRALQLDGYPHVLLRIGIAPASPATRRRRLREMITPA